MRLSNNHQAINDGLLDEFDKSNSEIKFVCFTDLGIKNPDILINEKLKGLRKKRVTEKKKRDLLRDILIHCGHLCGPSQRELSKATGITKSRIGTILIRLPELREFKRGKDGRAIKEIEQIVPETT